MSDGPHRSLPMRRAWKELAKRADKKTYDLDQVREAVPQALANDWRNEVSPALVTAIRNVFAGKENSLHLREIALDQLEAAKRLAAGSVFGSNAVAWAIQLIHEGRTDAGALYDVVGLAAKERGYACFRQVEEHYLRESTERRADGVRSRLEGAVSGLSVTQLGTMILEPSARRVPRKHTQLDEGVSLS
jgi:hypothetical protein